MYGCESWTVKKAEHQRIDAFEPWCWRRLLRVPWTARRSIQSNLKEIIEYSLEGLMLKLQLQYFGHLSHWKRPLCWQRLKAGGEGMTEDEMVGWHHWLSGHEFEKTPEDSEGQGNLACYSLWGCKSQTWLSNWLTTNINNMGAAKNSNGGQVCATFHCICAEILLCMKAIRVCVCVCVYSKIILVSER